MDWTQVLVILGGFGGGFIYLSSKMDALGKDLSKEIQNLDKRLSRIEDRLEFSNKVVYIQHEETKKEAK